MDSLAIDIFVDEHAFQSLELSLQYDSYYHLVPIAKFDWDNLFLSGIRWESQLSLMGYTRLLSELSYHPQEVMYSVYPFLQVEYRDIPKSVYNGLGQRLTIFQERITDMAFGAGIQFRENIYSRIGFSLQDLRLSPALQLHLPGLTFSPETHYRLHLLQVSGKFDFLDSYVTPNRGFLVEASYALSILGQRSITVVWRHLWIITDRLANATALT